MDYFKTISWWIVLFFRGSIASIAERPRYKKLEKDIKESEKEMKQTEL